MDLFAVCEPAASDQISIPSLGLVLVNIGIEGQCESWRAQRSTLLGILDLLALSLTCVCFFSNHSNAQHLSTCASFSKCLRCFFFF